MIMTTVFIIVSIIVHVIVALQALEGGSMPQHYYFTNMVVTKFMN